MVTPGGIMQAQFVLCFVPANSELGLIGFREINETTLGLAGKMITLPILNFGLKL